MAGHDSPCSQSFRYEGNSSARPQGQEIKGRGATGSRISASLPACVTDTSSPLSRVALGAGEGRSRRGLGVRDVDVRLEASSGAGIGVRTSRVVGVLGWGSSYGCLTRSVPASSSSMLGGGVGVRSQGVGVRSRGVVVLVGSGRPRVAASLGAEQHLQLDFRHSCSGIATSAFHSALMTSGLSLLSLKHVQALLASINSSLSLLGSGVDHMALIMCNHRRSSTGRRSRGDSDSHSDKDGPVHPSRRLRSPCKLNR